MCEKLCTLSRLVGYGYAIKDVEGAQVVTKLPQGTELGILPAHLL